MKYVCEVTKIAAMNDLDWKTVCTILLFGRVNCSYWFSCDWDTFLNFKKIHAKSKCKGVES